MQDVKKGLTKGTTSGTAAVLITVDCMMKTAENCDGYGGVGGERKVESYDILIGTHEKKKQTKKNIN